MQHTTRLKISSQRRRQGVPWQAGASDCRIVRLQQVHYTRIKNTQQSKYSRSMSSRTIIRTVEWGCNGVHGIANMASMAEVPECTSLPSAVHSGSRGFEHPGKSPREPPYPKPPSFLSAGECRDTVHPSIVHVKPPFPPPQSEHIRQTFSCFPYYAYHRPRLISPCVTYVADQGRRHEAEPRRQSPLTSFSPA